MQEAKGVETEGAAAEPADGAAGSGGSDSDGGPTCQVCSLVVMVEIALSGDGGDSYVLRFRTGLICLPIIPTRLPSPCTTQCPHE